MFNFINKKAKQAIEAKVNSMDLLATNVMIANTNLEITYLNKSITEMLKAAESDIQKDLPRFSVATLIGSNIDIFHKNPSHQRTMLERLNTTHKATIQIGGRTFDLNANPIFDENNNRIATAVEWLDSTALVREKARNIDFTGQIDAIGKSQAVISFNMDGTIIEANQNFLGALGYTLDEIKGKHHSMFVEPAYKNSIEYAQFWEALNRGQFQAAEYKHIGKNGKEVWIQASYNPIMDQNGKPFKVVKYATDTTAQKLQNADFAGQIDAIGKSQAVISFNMDGTIIEANQNFLSALGYVLDEVKGKHHSMFVEPNYRASVEYSQFWDALNRGQYQAAEYKRIGKNGKEVWIQASYNPIMDLNGKPFKVVKYATETTKQKLQNADYAGQIDAIGKSQAVISFNMDGTIIEANQNFLSTLGYSLDEIKGKHHSMFVEPNYKASIEYAQFWEALNRGQYQAAEYKRIGKNGKEVWIQASYNPILDLNGKPFKVVNMLLM